MVGDCVITKGRRMEICVMQLWTYFCWLLPMAAEFLLRRFVSLTPTVQAALLLGSFLFNRVLVSCAHAGYYAAAKRAAALTAAPSQNTCVMENLHIVWEGRTLLQCFFGAYRHPLTHIKSQLRWDACRFGLYAAALFPAAFILAWGAQEETAVVKVLFLGISILLAALGVLVVWTVVRRLETAVVGGLPIFSGFHLARGWSGQLLHLHFRSFLLAGLPFSIARFAVYVAIVQRVRRRCVTMPTKNNGWAIHTRVT